MANSQVPWFLGGVALVASLYLNVTPAPATPIQWRIEDGGNGHYYDLILPDTTADNYTWHRARNEAANSTFLGMRGHLVTVTSLAEDVFLRATFGAFISDIGGALAWIGLTDEGVEGDYRWITGESFSYANWAPGEPNNIENEDYVHYWRRDFGSGPQWSWNDDRTQGGTPDARYGYIVEYDQVPDEDPDGDGVLDDEDECPDSNLSATIVTDGCDSKVTNTVFPSGCTLADLLADCADDARKHRKFVHCVARLTRTMKRISIITGQQKDAIQDCAVRTDLP